MVNKRFKNKQTSTFLETFIGTSLDNDHDLLTKKCKFNFSYFVKQDAGQEFSEWTHEQLIHLLESLKNWSEFPLMHWTSPTLTFYGDFPTDKSDFIKPDHVPQQARWGRFRLSSAVRLIGFSVPGVYDKKEHHKTKQLFDSNTFYVVFLDKNHVFYKSEKK